MVGEQIKIYSYTVDSGKNMLVNGGFDFPEVLWEIIGAEKRPIFHSTAQRKADPVSREKDPFFLAGKIAQEGNPAEFEGARFLERVHNGEQIEHVASSGPWRDKVT